MARIQHDRTGPAQTLSRKAIQISESLVSRGNTITLRWVLAHLGVEGNERADAVAKRAAEGEEGRVEPPFIQEASLSYLNRKVTEARSKATSNWIREHSGQRRRYRPPTGGKVRKALARERKEVARRFYQLLSGHAATGEHLLRINQIEKDECFWCGSGERQTRFHLFVRRRRWGLEVRNLWRRIKLESGWGGAPSIHRLFGDERNTPAVLKFPRKTKVGKMPSRFLLAGGPDLEEEELGGFPLRVLGEETSETEDISSEEEEDGLDPPL